jgi:hypothetical protein
VILAALYALAASLAGGTTPVLLADDAGTVHVFQGPAHAELCAARLRTWTVSGFAIFDEVAVVPADPRMILDTLLAADGRDVADMSDADISALVDARTAVFETQTFGAADTRARAIELTERMARAVERRFARAVLSMEGYGLR